MELQRIDRNHHLHLYPKSSQGPPVRNSSSSHFHALPNHCNYAALQTAVCFVHVLEYALFIYFFQLKLPLLAVLVALRQIPLPLPPVTL